MDLVTKANILRTSIVSSSNHNSSTEITTKDLAMTSLGMMAQPLLLGSRKLKDISNYATY
jgi:hypothetical protein